MVAKISENRVDRMNVFTLAHVTTPDSLRIYFAKNYGVDVKNVRVTQTHDGLADVEFTLVNMSLFSSKTVTIKDITYNSKETLAIRDYAKEKLKGIPNDANLDSYVQRLNTELQQQYSTTMFCHPTLTVEKNKDGTVTYILKPKPTYPLWGGIPEESIAFGAN